MVNGRLLQEVRFLWVTSGRHPETEALICKATKSKFSHAAVRLPIPEKTPSFGSEDCIIEAVRPCVQIVPGNSFDDYAVKEELTVYIPDEDYQKMREVALLLEGRPYSVGSCLTGGAEDLLGETASNLVDLVVDDESGIDCSGLLSTIIRAAYPAFGEGEEVSHLTPEKTRILCHEFFRDF